MGAPTPTSRSREAETFLDALQHSAPQAVSACEGWTTHEVTAHLAAGAAEVTRHLEPYLRGEQVPDTQSFEVREAPYRAMDDPELRRRLEIEEDKMRSAIDQVLAKEPEAVIPWTGRRMAVAKFVPHMRNEFAVHRWDFAGDGEVGHQLLAQPELTEHAVGVLGRLLLVRGRHHDPGAGRNFAVRLRSEGKRDVRVVVDGEHAGLELVGQDSDEPYADLDAAARTLVIWGRRPGPEGPVPQPHERRGPCAPPSPPLRLLTAARPHPTVTGPGALDRRVAHSDRPGPPPCQTCDLQPRPRQTSGPPAWPPPRRSSPPPSSGWSSTVPSTTGKHSPPTSSGTLLRRASASGPSTGRRSTPGSSAPVAVGPDGGPGPRPTDHTPNYALPPGPRFARGRSTPQIATTRGAAGHERRPRSTT